MIDENENFDWEPEDLEIPPWLKKKWEKEERKAKGIVCQSCGKAVREDALLCLYCGNPTGIKVGFLNWLKIVCFGKVWRIIVFLVICIMIAIFLIM